MVPEIGEEIVYRLGDVTPQRGVHARLVGVAVEAAVVAVEDPGAQPSQVHLSDSPQLLGDGRFGIFDVGGVELRGGL